MDEKYVQQNNGDKLCRRTEEQLDENRGTTPLVGTEEDQRNLHELRDHRIELEMQDAELLQTRETLEATLQKYQNFFDFAPVGYLTLNRDGAIQDVNLTGASLLGLEKSCLLGRRFGLFVTEEYRFTFAGFLDAVFTSQDNKVCEVSLLNAGNALVFVQIEARADNAGQECLLALIDITERKAVDQKLRESERIYRAIGESIDYGIWICAPDGRNTYASDSFLNLVGITQEQCSNFGWGEVLHPEDADRTIDAWKECVSIECDWDIEPRYRGVDGQWHHILARGVPVRDDQGTITCWAGINLDISRFKEVEKNLRESEERHRLLSETMLQGVVHQDANGTIISMNPAAERILGKSREDFLGNNSVTVEHDTIRENGEIFPGTEHPAMVALQTGQPVRDVVMGVFNPKLGEYRWINVNAVPIFRQHDTCPSEVYAVIEDITDSKQAEEALRKNEKKLSDIYASMSEGLALHEIVYDNMGKAVDYKIIDVNHAFEIITGLERSSVIEKKASELYGTGEAPYLDRYAEVESSGKPTFFEEHFVPMNKHFHISVFSPEKGKFATIFQDITERKQAEEALKQLNDELEERVVQRTEELRAKDEMLLLQSRQAAMGEMIGNIAHQWRQPLNVLGLNIQQQMLYYDLGEFTREFLKNSVNKSMEVIQHMSRTIDDFRNFFKPDKESAEFKVSDAITSTLALVEESFNNDAIGIDVITKDDAVINGYKNEYAQVILNILNNARDALVERGIKDRRVTIALCAEEGKSVVTITDNAGGIPEENVAKIFDPYFTTKGPQTGTGVGLFMSKTIIEKNMNGRLTALNIEGGAEFRIEV